MGQTLSEPITQKHSDSGSDERFAYGVSEMQGWRLSMFCRTSSRLWPFSASLVWLCCFVLAVWTDERLEELWKTVENLRRLNFRYLPAMEDAHATILDLDKKQSTDSSQPASKEKMSFFSVYDGHGG